MTAFGKEEGFAANQATASICSPQVTDMKSFICCGTLNVIQSKILILRCMKVSIYSVRDPLRGTVMLQTHRPFSLH